VAVNTVATVDAKRYAGQWFEVARIPNRFQEQCVGDVTALYSPQGDGQVAVTNRCRLADGRVDSVDGLARAVEGDNSGARLEVSFLPAWLRWLPFGWGDYWVVELDPAYRLAVVSDRTGEYLWVLSREPRLRPAAYDALIKRLRARGFAVQRLVRTTQRTADR
jgi:apolipoprotein D and lipocalin family protein